MLKSSKKDESGIQVKNLVLTIANEKGVTLASAWMLARCYFVCLKLLFVMNKNGYDECAIAILCVRGNAVCQ